MRVIVPEAILPEWVGTASKEVQDRYSRYYSNHRLEAQSEGWTSWVCRKVARYSFGFIQVGSSLVLGRAGNFASGVVLRNEMPYQVAGQVVEAAHALHVQHTRVPIEHTRVSNAVNRLYEIKNCTNGDEFITRLLAVYTKQYLASCASYNLKTTLASPTVGLDKKIDQIVQYLLRTATLKGYENLFYNNGKQFFQKIVVLAENSTIAV